jgi:hypothetical protein
LADTHRRATGPEAAAIPLRSALEAAKALPDPVQRATLLAELTELLPDALLFPESKQALQDATEAARGIIAPDQRLPLLVVILHHAFNAGEIQTAAALATEAMEIAPKVKLSPPLVTELAEFLTRLGDWPAALSLLPEIESNTAAPDDQPSKTPESGPPVPSPLPATPAAETAASRRRALLDAIATTAAEEAIGYDPAAPPNRGEPLDRIRNRAISDEPAAASYLPGIPAGYQRARATLAIAKGLLLPPIPSAETPLPTDLSGPLDLLPGQSPDVPVMPEDPEAK